DGARGYPPAGRVTASRFSRDGRKLATFAGSVVRVWNAGNGEPLASLLPVFDGPGPALTPRLEFSGDARRLAAVFPVGAGQARRDGPPAAVVWDVDARARLFTLPARIESGPQVFGDRDVNNQVRNAALSPDGTLLAAAVESSGEVSVFDLGTSRRLHRTKGFRGFLSVLGFHPSGRTLIV